MHVLLAACLARVHEAGMVLLMHLPVHGALLAHLRHLTRRHLLGVHLTGVLLPMMWLPGVLLSWW